jgi:hypothetical protein
MPHDSSEPPRSGGAETVRCQRLLGKDTKRSYTARVRGPAIASESTYAAGAVPSSVKPSGEGGSTKGGIGAAPPRTTARRCSVANSSTNAAAPTDTVKVTSSQSMCAVQTSNQLRSMPTLPIISCISAPSRLNRSRLSSLQQPAVAPESTYAAVRAPYANHMGDTLLAAD